MATQVKVLMDCDSGHDDAFALIVASKFAEVLGVTTVAGNAPLSWTTKNARIILDICGSNVSLHSGASRPLVAEPIHASYIHGESGMDGANFAEPSRPADGIFSGNRCVVIWRKFCCVHTITDSYNFAGIN